MKAILMTPVLLKKINPGYGVLVPLGIAYLGAVLRKSGWTIKVIDPQVELLDYKQVREIISKFKPEIIGISVMTPQAKDAYRTARSIRRDFPQIKIVMGGAHAICYPQAILAECDAVDVVVTDEAETIISDLFSQLSSKNPDLAKIPGIAFRNGSQNVVTEKISTHAKLEALPFPARDLFNLEKYKPEVFETNRLPATNIIISRGCPYSLCTFCHRSGLLKRQYRVQSPQKTIREIKSLMRRGIHDFVFYDDDLLSNQKWVLEFCELVENERLKIKWVCRGRTAVITKPLLFAIKKAGCWCIEIGFESGNQDLLDNIRKGTTADKGLQVAKWCKEIGLQVTGTFMLGLPGETPQKAKKTIKYAIEADCDYAAFIPTHPFPGTKLYEECASENQSTGANPPITDAYQAQRVSGIRYLPDISYLPKGYKNKAELEKMIRRAYLQFYLRPAFWWKHIKRIRTFGDVTKYVHGLRMFWKIV